MICTDCGTALEKAKLDDAESCFNIASVLVIIFVGVNEVAENW
jgi:uncharacterized protein (DUF983 family)